MPCAPNDPYLTARPATAQSWTRLRFQLGWRCALLSLGVTVLAAALGVGIVVVLTWRLRPEQPTLSAGGAVEASLLVGVLAWLLGWVATRRRARAWRDLEAGAPTAEDAERWTRSDAATDLLDALQRTDVPLLRGDCAELTARAVAEDHGAARARALTVLAH